jgi:hypothetical protein
MYGTQHTDPRQYWIIITRIILKLEVLQFLLLIISFSYLNFVTWKNLKNTIQRIFVLISELCAFCL